MFKRLCWHSIPNKSFHLIDSAHHSPLETIYGHCWKWGQRESISNWEHRADLWYIIGMVLMNDKISNVKYSVIPQRSNSSVTVRSLSGSATLFVSAAAVQQLVSRLDTKCWRCIKIGIICCWMLVPNDNAITNMTDITPLITHFERLFPLVTCTSRQGHDKKRT